MQIYNWEIFYKAISNFLYENQKITVGGKIFCPLKQ